MKPVWKDNKKYAVALSHDVDYPEMIRWIEILRKKNVFDVFKDNFWKFKDWVKLEKRYGMKSAFYFCGRQGNLLKYALGSRDPFYDVRKKKFKDIMHYLIDEGFEVGMHASCSAYHSEKNFRDEKKIVEEALGQPIYGNRHHYSQINFEDPIATLKIQGKIGLIYDTTINFRFSEKCFPYHPYDPVKKEPLPILELPITITDCQLFKYIPVRQTFTPNNNYRFEIDTLVDSVREAGGLLMASFHVRVLNETFFPEWGKIYEYLLQKITQTDDYYCDTPINIARYWLGMEAE